MRTTTVSLWLKRLLFLMVVLTGPVLQAGSYSLKDTTAASEFANLARALLERSRYDSSIYYYQEAADIYAVILRTQNSDSAFWEKSIVCRNGIGRALRESGKYIEAEQYLLGVLQEGLTKLGEENRVVASTFDLLGINYWYKGDYDTALEYLEQGLRITKSVSGESHPDFAVPLTNLGIVYDELGEFDRALEYYRKSIALRVSLESRDLNLAKMYNNIAVVYGNLGDYSKALEYCEKDLELTMSLIGEENPSVAHSYNNIGIIHTRLNEFGIAMEYFKKTESIMLKLVGRLHPLVAMCYINMGDLMAKQADFDAAITHYRLASRIGQEVLGTFNPLLAIANKSLAQAYFDDRQLLNAISSCQKALSSCVYDFADESPTSNPTLKDINSESVLLQILKLKARVLHDLAHTYDNHDYEIAALSTYNLASELIDKIRTGYTSESSKLTLGREAFDVYQHAMQMCIELYLSSGNQEYLDSAFRFSEKNKSSILSDALQESRAKTFAGIPDSILAKEKQLKIDLAFYETQILKEKQEEETPTIELSGNQEQFFALKRDYEEFIEQLEQQYPKYFDLKYQTETTTIQELQRRIDAETTVIEYFTAQNTIYIFTISNKDHTVTAAPKDSLFEKVIEELRASLQADNNEQYRRTAGQLYNILIQPIQERLDTPHLVIIPDGPLTAIPFEVLLENSAPSAPNASYPHLPYLMRKFDISYAYSATLFLETLDKPLPEHNKELIAFAPVFPDELSSGTRAAELFAANRAFDLSWTEEPIALPASRDEVLGIQQVFREQLGPIDWISDWLFDSKSLVVLEQEATEAHLKEIPLQNYNYVHFATHGFANRNVKNLSGLVFAQDSTSSEDDILFMDEIYNLELDAELVTLSACESGVGQLVQGEGLLNMSRGFLYAGARNLLVSLWKADDRSTCELMVAFYRNLLEGHSKARALKQAKLHMLNNPINAIPSQWAAFVLIGE